MIHCLPHHLLVFPVGSIGSDDTRFHAIQVEAPDQADQYVGFADIFLTPEVSEDILSMGARVTHDSAVGLAHVETLDNGGWSTADVLQMSKQAGWQPFRIKRNDCGVWIYLRKADEA